MVNIHTHKTYTDASARTARVLYASDVCILSRVTKLQNNYIVKNHIKNIIYVMTVYHVKHILLDFNTIYMHTF